MVIKILGCILIGLIISFILFCAVGAVWVNLFDKESLSDETSEL